MTKAAISSHYKLPDTKQSSWQLAMIQLTSILSLPVIATSFFILEDNSFANSLAILVISNVILWFLRLGILTMSHRKRKSTMDLSHDYIGRLGSYVIAVILLGATLSWYMIQTRMASTALMHLTSFEKDIGIDRLIQIAVGIGILSTFFCMEGIVLLRLLSMVAFPILIITFLALIFLAPEQSFPTEPFKISLYSVALVVGTNLGITVDMPTFFRHSQSWKASLKALTAIQIFSFLIGVGGLYVGGILSPLVSADGTQTIFVGSHWLELAAVILIFISAVCANVSNVYSASVGWELVAPSSLVGRKEYLILGLSLTSIFILLSQFFSMMLLLHITDSAVINLCVVLLIAYARKKISDHAPREFDKLSYFIAWLAATIVSTGQHSKIFLHQFSSLETSVSVIVVVVAIMALWQKLFLKRRKRA